MVTRRLLLEAASTHQRIVNYLHQARKEIGYDAIAQQTPDQHAAAAATTAATAATTATVGWGPTATAAATAANAATATMAVTGG